ncbi:hypothetical protein ACQP1G_29025 [Nocardia sp. CA-107356]|uniref:hypothetical protein n=1 Tax=Nocardia sp. CA-107356 TaxID=3239972 RepID=UPI003D8FBA80
MIKGNPTMKLFRTAIGYLRSDVSGSRQTWDEIQIRSLAGRLGYTLAKTVTCNGRTDDPMAQLITTVRNADADVVITPHVNHLGGIIPRALDRAASVITVAPEPA